MYKNINDYELLYLISENHEEAYYGMYNKYDKLIKLVAHKYYRNSKYLGISWDDIYQAGLYGFDQALKSFDEKVNVTFYTYGVTFIKREINALIRKSNRMKHNLLSDAISLDMEVGEDSTVGDFVKVNDLDYIRLQTDIDILNFKYELPFLQSQVYELRLNHFNNKEIAILLNLKYKTVDNAITYIKNKLRKMQNMIAVFW